MLHTLVIPSDLEQKLAAACSDPESHSKWLAAGVDTAGDMLERIRDRLNERNPKLEVCRIRYEDKGVIKERIRNSSRVSKFAGYFENEENRVDSLFFYVDPKADNANDFLASKIPPVLIGMYKNYADRTRDLHINNMPVYVVSLCTTGRVTNASVKQQIICAETMGLNYIDIFDNQLYDIIQPDGESPAVPIKTLRQLDELISQGGRNDYFQLDPAGRTIRITCVNVLQRTNDTAYIYRWFLRVIPAVYLASNEGYHIDLSAIQSITNEDIQLIRSYINRFSAAV